ncbi:isoleucine--tRNA ligase [Thermoproteota archaeon]
MPQNDQPKNYDFKFVEENILNYWEKNQIYPKLRKNLEGKQKFFFIQGPPYTSGRLHIGHAWNNTLKDLLLRYKRMKGFDVFDRAAYDMHGLPTARKVMEEQNLKTKEEILEFGMEKFIKECMKYCVDKAKLMDKDLWRLGVWMDYPNARYPIDNSYIEGVWLLIKKAHEKKRLYEGLRTMSWCASCQTALAKHECEYEEVVEPSIFVKFPVAGKENEYLIIWTTTPWTITYNLAIMVHPELEYVKAKVGDEVWILAKGLAAPVIQSFTDSTLEIIEEFPGKQLEGLEYKHPWDKRWNHYKEIKAKHPKTHTVLLSEEYVNLTAGTGLVHCAPGCGPEDYEVGYKNNIPAFNNLREDGIFPDDMGEFSGLKAKTDDKKFVEALKKDGILVATTNVEHDYAHCERCHSPVIFRTTKQWFFKVEDLKERMVKANEKIHWVPEAGKNAFKSWLENLRDNSITKQRFWGTPAPIWKCETCGKVEIIGSALELKEKAGHCPDNLHKPWIDEVEINCDCGAMMKRLPDVLDVWIDAGTLSWNILDYPGNKDLYKKLWPADFILEAKEQIRGWFNMLMVTSIIALDDPVPFLNCYMHGMLTDVEGVKMSKSLGNVISPYELIDKHGADTLRYYMHGTTAGEDINFSWQEAALKHRNLGVLWNVHKYLIDMKKLNNFKIIDDISTMKDKLGDEERYILSKTHSTIKKVTELFEGYYLDSIPSVIEELFLELSRTYIQLTRDKSIGDEKEVVFQTIHASMKEILKVLTPVAPFITEQMYLNLKEELGSQGPESIHMLEWPEAKEEWIDEKLEKKFDVAKAAIQGILAARERAQLGVRWPVKEIIIVTTKDEVKEGIESLSGLIQKQTNVKKLSVKEKFDKIKTGVKADYAKLGPEFGDVAPKIIAQLSLTSPESIMKKISKEGKCIITTDVGHFEITREHLIEKREVPEPYTEGEFRGNLVYLDKTRTPDLEAEGYARELMRRVQALRKKEGLQKQDSIDLYIITSEEMEPVLQQWKDAIKEKVGAKTIVVARAEPSKTYSASNKEKIKEQGFDILFNKL